MCAERWMTGLVVAAAAGACASHTAPEGFLATPDEAQTEARGAWIELHLGSGPQDRVAGELIAVSEDSAWVLELSGDAIRVAHAGVTDGHLVAYQSQYGRVGSLAMLGTLSTVSNGGFLLLTGPMWIIGGAVAAASQSRAPIRAIPPQAWTELAAFARFPQGIPQDLELDALLPPPLGAKEPGDTAPDSASRPPPTSF